MKSKKILLVARKISGVSGGVERSVCLLANLYSDNGYKVHILTWDKSVIIPYYSLNEKVKLTGLNLGSVSKKM